jgi:hypothetical protein
MFRRIVILASATLLISGAVAHAADPAVSCESGKLKVAGKYTSCVLSADAKSVKTGLAVDYTKCDATLGVKWEIAEGKGEGMCPGGDGDQTAISSFLDACTGSVAAALAGDAPLPTDVQTCNTALTTCGGDLSTCNTNYTTCSGDLGTCNADYLTCLGDLSTCEAQPLAQPATSGQTLCYNTTGSVIACAGTSQDGELQRGVARSFTDNGDGTITDNVTGLMWEKLSDDGTIHDWNDAYTWANAFTKVSTLNSTSFAGYDDWRVPNLVELETLRNLGAVDPATYSSFYTGCAPGCTVTTCSCTRSTNYWSSSTYADTPSYAWNVDFYDGDNVAPGKTTTNYVRAVRSGS